MFSIYNPPLFQTYDLYFFVCFVLFYKEFQRRKKGSKVEVQRKVAWVDSVPKTTENITVKTALGKSIPVKQSLEDHFKQLNDAWKL